MLLNPKQANCRSDVGTMIRPHVANAFVAILLNPKQTNCRSAVGIMILPLTK